MLKKASEKYWNHISNIFGFRKYVFCVFGISAFDVELMTVHKLQKVVCRTTGPTVAASMNPWFIVAI